MEYHRHRANFQQSLQDLSGRLLAHNLYQRGFNNVYQVPKPHEMPQCSQSLIFAKASTSRLEAPSTTRSTFEVDNCHQDLMQDVTATDTQTLLNCGRNVSSVPTSGKPRGFDNRHAYPATKPKTSRRLRRMPHLDLEKEAA